MACPVLLPDAGSPQIQISQTGKADVDNRRMMCSVSNDPMNMKRLTFLCEAVLL